MILERDAVMDKGILMYESTLDADARVRLKEIGWADIVIGIPSHRNGRTIGEVVQAITRGISTYLTGYRVVLMDADGGSSDNTMRSVAEASVPDNVEKVVTNYVGPTGKGTAVRAIFEASAELNAKACMVVEARAHGITPEWLPALLTPVLSGQDMALACFQHSAYAAALTDNLAYPFLRVFFDADLREPLVTECCIAGSLAAEMAGEDVWETDVARFGINVWLALRALDEKQRVIQVDLGYRGESGAEPGALTDAHFLHTVGTLFRALGIHRHLWQKNPPERVIPFHGERSADRFVPSRDCVPALLDGLYVGQQHYESEWRRVLYPDTLQAVLDQLRQPRESFGFPARLWARVAIEFAVNYNRGEGDPDKVIESFLPLYCGRAAAYVGQTQHLTPAARETVAQEIVQTFADMRPLFFDLWSEYQTWGDGSD
jgi:glucosylglycerate synthase